MGNLRGTFTVMVTPFGEDEELDEKALRENIDWYIEQGIHGLICLGSTGEFASLSDEERKAVIEITVRQAKGRVPVIAGTASNTTRKVIEMTKYASKTGVDAVIIVPPYYGLPTQEDLYEHYRVIAENADIPLMVYNNPWYTGVDILPPLVESLAALDHIQYLKESTGDIKRLHEILHRCGDRIDVWCGWDDLAYEFFVWGCTGWVAPVGNILPRASAELFNLMEHRRYEEARALFFKLLPLLSYLEAGQLTSKVKEAMNMIGHPAGRARRPFLPVSESDREKLHSLLISAGALSS